MSRKYYKHNEVAENEHDNEVNHFYREPYNMQMNVLLDSYAMILEHCMKSSSEALVNKKYFYIWCSLCTCRTPLHLKEVRPTELYS